MKFVVSTLAPLARNHNARAVIPLMNCEYRRSDCGVTGVSTPDEPPRWLKTSGLTRARQFG